MNNITRFDSPSEMAEGAADLFTKYCHAAIKNIGRFTVALSGGNTPGALYQMLAAPPYNKLIDWKNVFVFWGDERCVSAGSRDNNSHNAKEALLDNIPMPKENVFAVPVQLSPAEAAANYAQTLRTFFKTEAPAFDLILLGMGDNGHTASLFPHTEVLSETVLTVKEIFVKEVNMWRITFTAPLINNAKHILFLVAGKGKEPMLNNILNGKYEPEKYPAQLIRHAEWFVSLS